MMALIAGNEYAQINISGSGPVHLGNKIYSANETDKLHAISRWLKAPDASIEHNAAFTKHQQGTGDWLLKREEYKRWKTETPSFLWLYGVAGCGKSVILSHVIETLISETKRDEVAVAFFYFTHLDVTKQNACAMLKYLLLQLCQQSSAAADVVYEVQQEYQGKAPPHTTLLNLTMKIAAVLQEVYILVDALDECPDEERPLLLEMLQQLQSCIGGSFHIIATSRNIFDVRLELGDDPSKRLYLKNEEIDVDIKRFIELKLESDSYLSKWSKSSRELIKNDLSSKADGVFRWVECQFAALRHCPRSPHHLQRCLDNLPKTLDETYQRMLLSIDKPYSKEAERLLSFLIVAQTPPRVPEVIDALAVDLDSDSSFDTDRRLQGSADLHLICPGFFVTEDSDQRVIWKPKIWLAHFSVKEYLCSSRRKGVGHFAMSSDIQAAHALVCKVCLVYLFAIPLLQHQAGHRVLEYAESVKAKFPFAFYAARNWHLHYRLSSTGHQEDMMKHLVRLFTEPYILNVRALGYGGWTDSHFLCQALQHAVHLRLSVGIEVVLARIGAIIAITLDIEEAQLWFGRAADQLVRSDNLNFALAVFDKHSELRPTTQNSLHALLTTIVKRHSPEAGFELYTMLAGQMQLPESPNKLLMVGAVIREERRKARSTDWCRALVDYGADVNTFIAEDDVPIVAAIETEDIKMCQLLIERGANVDVTLEDGSTALTWAVRVGIHEICALLLSASTNPTQLANRPDSRDLPPLHMAIENWDYECCLALVAGGARLDTCNPAGHNALTLAAEHGYNDICQYLVHRGADVNAMDDIGRTPLHAAFWGRKTQLSWRSSLRHSACLQFLCESGADIAASMPAILNDDICGAFGYIHLDIRYLFVDRAEVDINRVINGETILDKLRTFNSERHDYATVRDHQQLMIDLERRGALAATQVCGNGAG